MSNLTSAVKSMWLRCQRAVSSFRLSSLMPACHERCRPLVRGFRRLRDHLLAERLEVEIVETGEPELLLDVDSLLQRGGRLEESVEKSKAGELEGAAVVAAQHPWV